MPGVVLAVAFDVRRTRHAACRDRSRYVTRAGSAP
jgi:hypothetical protein